MKNWTKHFEQQVTSGEMSMDDLSTEMAKHADRYILTGEGSLDDPRYKGMQHAHMRLFDRQDKAEQASRSQS